jgi:hypothetical protein
MQLTSLHNFVCSLAHTRKTFYAKQNWPQLSAVNTNHNFRKLLNPEKLLSMKTLPCVKITKHIVI